MKVVINTCYGGFGLSEAAYEKLIEWGISVRPRYWDTWTSDNRSHPLLVRLVEEMGDGASGQYASLKVVEIPDDVRWHVEEYDGMEWVAEDHRTWR